jgi:PPM family protein phosphatase
MPLTARFATTCGVCGGRISPSDRYLLCSDGLSAVVDRSALHAALSVPAEPEQVAGQLIDLAYAHGAPDNIACVVADAVTG